jgi:hypothetical protein
MERNYQTFAIFDLIELKKESMENPHRARMEREEEGEKKFRWSKTSLG